ncbi:hypothetical protein SAMN02745249_01993 [Atopostipes suicloacalis DSM 15692]|uniref:Small integral membrane protein n=1 Tax=Atopostipes suicloacalis DSM 15692 TaxID=1121025 RepID=A0A1M4ZL85_9LACT|nr:hypothetical protein [Atopostipes suicloacalis]SHF18803.1 hypothetical protein SAMN02745249_01993 [Atopostipes suicloacalis DSM 15692]
MKKSNGKYFVGVGVLLIIAGILIFSDDGVIGIIGIIFGLYNLIKGIRLLRGIQPMLIRKQQKRYDHDKEELRDKFEEANKKDKD